MMRSHFKLEFRAYMDHVARDAAIGLFLGFIPAVFHASDHEKFQKLVDSLLTSGWLTNYYGYLFSIFMFLALFKTLFRFGQDWAQRLMSRFFKFAAEVCTSLSTALRTGFGLIIGFIVMWPLIEPQTLTIGNFISTAILALLTLLMSAFISFVQSLLLSGFQIIRSE